MGIRSIVFAGFLVCATILSMSPAPATAQASVTEQASAATGELIVVGNEAAFLGSDPIPLEIASDVVPGISRPSAEDLSGLLPVVPDGPPSMNVPDSDAEGMILPPASGAAVSMPASSPVPPWPFEKSDGPGPLLIQDAEIVSTGPSGDQKESRAELIGRLAIEEHHVARRKMLRRWVLKTVEGERIPLTSNFQLLSAVKKAGIPDETVKVTGKWTTSTADPRLKYFTGDRFETVGTQTTDISSMSTSLPVGSGTTSVASATTSVTSDTAAAAPIASEAVAP